ncbi:conserved hypothetical protein [Cenarchaeum symbiosum A]|uniref:Uncharacterized protein n=1 Tax=Cenarchaeum symbiosum (strain A) TaxID=414004 RepID=A0RZ52_CENSY|nr:conserved hypothetical protein [Cenarchaeum symbiosum A]
MPFNTKEIYQKFMEEQIKKLTEAVVELPTGEDAEKTRSYRDRINEIRQDIYDSTSIYIRSIEKE